MTSCGFKLANTNAPVHICVDGDNSQITEHIRSDLNAHCDNLANRLHVLSIYNNEELVTLSANNNIQQYVLTKTMSFELYNANGKLLTSETKLRTQKPLTINNNVLLGSLDEKNRLLREMQHNLDMQLRSHLRTHNEN